MREQTGWDTEGPDGEIGSLQMWQQKMLVLIGVNVVGALSYTLFPKQGPGGPAPVEQPRSYSDTDR